MSITTCKTWVLPQTRHYIRPTSCIRRAGSNEIVSNCFIYPLITTIQELLSFSLLISKSENINVLPTERRLFSGPVNKLLTYQTSSLGKLVQSLTQPNQLFHSTPQPKQSRSQEPAKSKFHFVWLQKLWNLYARVLSRIRADGNGNTNRQRKWACRKEWNGKK